MMIKRNYKLLFYILVLSFLLINEAGAQVNFDLENLRNQKPLLTKAYDIIKIQDAWEKIKSLNPPLSNISIGIVDTGVDSKHQEFNNPNVNIDAPFNALFDARPEGHGTKVNGIIGANNILGSGGILAPDSPQMNGILSGTLKENQYKLINENFNFSVSTFTQTIGVSAALENVLKKNPQIVNMSFANYLCSALSDQQKKHINNKCIQTNTEFGDIKKSYSKFFKSHINDILFIAGGGNFGILVSNALPGGINLDNIINVGATDLTDQRAVFDESESSNFGTNISAPGQNVYTSRPNNNYDKPIQLPIIGTVIGGFSGTSASVPMVTGVAGLLKALESEYQKHTFGLIMSPQKIKEILVASADPINTGESDKKLGSGCYNEKLSDTGCRLNAHRAVAWLLPPASSILNVATTTSNSISLSWTRSDDFQNPDFASYKIFRSVSPNVTPNNSLIAAITDPNQTTFMDIGLTSNTTFFYKVFVFDKANLSAGSNEVSAKTVLPQPSNTWQSVGPMTTERADHTSTLLNDGRVLITGGFKDAGSTFSELASAEVFNPNTNTFSLVGNMSTPRAFHTATLLSNGKVLITGGTKDGGNTILNSAELFDPQTNIFTSISNLNQKRFFHTADILPDGKVLIAGGNNGFIPLKSTEIFDLSTNTFSSGSDMIKERAHHASAKLNDGRVLLVNGGGLIIGALMAVETYNPNTNTFALATSSAEQLGLSVNTLPSGKVLIEGSKLFDQPNGEAAEIFNPADNSFTEIGPMLIFGIASNSAVLLNNGKVLFVGDNIKSQLFDSQTNTFSLTGNLNIPRFIGHRLTLLQDGRVLLTGGQIDSANSAEVFKP